MAKRKLRRTMLASMLTTKAIFIKPITIMDFHQVPDALSCEHLVNVAVYTMC